MRVDLTAAPAIAPVVGRGVPARGPATCAVIPAHDEASTVDAVVRGARRSVDAVLVVDDGSRDGTGPAARLAGAHVIRHEVRRGKGRALRTGFSWARAAGFDRIVTLDADGQHDPAWIGRLTAAGQRADLVIGSRRFGRGEAPALRAFGNGGASLLVSLVARRRFRDTQSGFRWMRAAILDGLPLRAEGFDIETEVLVLAARAGARIAEVPIPTLYHDRGSDFRTWRDSAAFLWRAGVLAAGERY